MIKLKECRLQKGLTQKELATKIGYKNNSISDWEKGLTEPPIEIIKKLATILDISTDELLGYENYSYNFKYEHENTKLIHKEKRK